MFPDLPKRTCVLFSLHAWNPFFQLSVMHPSGPYQNPNVTCSFNHLPSLIMKHFLLAWQILNKQYDYIISTLKLFFPQLLSFLLERNGWYYNIYLNYMCLLYPSYCHIMRIKNNISTPYCVHFVYLIVFLFQGIYSDFLKTNSDVVRFLVAPRIL